MSKVTPFPCCNDFHDRRYAGLELTGEDFKLKSKFKVKLIKPIDEPAKGVPPEYDIPLHRFNFLNEKLKEFPLKECCDNIKLIDFGDGFGYNYAYHWENDPSCGLVGYTMKFDKDDIYVCPKTRINAESKLCCNKGHINIKASILNNCTIFATGELKIKNCHLENCYIFGEGSITDLKCTNRIRLIGKVNINDCKVSNKGCFLIYNPPELNQQPTTLIKCTISAPCELIGGVTLTNCTLNGKIRIQGTSTFHLTTFSDNVQVLSKNVNCSLSQLSGNCVISQSCTLNQTTVSGNAFIGGNANVSNSSISGTAIIVGNASVSSGTVSGGVITQSARLSSGRLSDHGLITGSSSVAGSVFGYGIVGGSGTSCSGSVSGLVTNGVGCRHGALKGSAHWDNRSCEETQKNWLMDERKDNIIPGQSPVDQLAIPSIV